METLLVLLFVFFCSITILFSWRCFFILQLTTELYEILEIVDKSSDHLYYMDPITDFLYPFEISLAFNWKENQLKNLDLSDFRIFLVALNPEIKQSLKFVN